MAKKSARSKGYRKNVTKKPYLSKKEIILLIAIVAVIIAGIVLFNAFYDDGSLDVVDGVAQTQGENSLIINAGTGNAPRYFKVGQLANVDGYALEAEMTGTDENVNHYIYRPEAESPIDQITVEATAYKAEQLASPTLAAYSSTTDGVCSEMGEAEVSGHEVQYFTYRREQAEDETAEPSSEAAETPSEDAADPEDAADEDAFTPAQTLSAFVSVGDHSVILQVRIAAESEADYVDDSILVDAMNQVLAALSFENK